MLRDNTEAQGTLDTNKFLPALLAHLHKPDLNTTMSRSNMVFCRKMKDLMPIKPARVKGIARRHMARSQMLNKQTRRLAPLKVGHTVSIENQHSNTPIKWDHTVMIVEVGDFDKYSIKVDGSGRLTNRNRRFLQPTRRPLAGRH